jgi:hypothetical protein
MAKAATTHEQNMAAHGPRWKHRSQGKKAAAPNSWRVKKPRVLKVRATKPEPVARPLTATIAEALRDATEERP